VLNDARDLCFSLKSRVVLLAVVAVVAVVVVAASSESLAFPNNHRVILQSKSSVHQNRN
jgi:hypothetical protein